MDNNNLHCCLSFNGYLISKLNITEKEYEKIKKELTKTPISNSFLKKKIFQKKEKIIIYLESTNYLILPRFYGITKFGNPIKSSISDGLPMQKDLTFTYKILPHQELALKKTIDVLTTKDGGVLSLPCGYGKTGIAIYTALHFGRKTGIIVTKDCLADQVIESIKKFTGGKAKIGRIQQSIYDIKDKDFVICMVHTFCLHDINKDDMKEFGMFIVDECHHMGSKMFSKALPKLGCKKLLGLSATPNRKDGLSDIFYHFLGDLFHSEKRSKINNVIVERYNLKSNSGIYDLIYNNLETINGSAMIEKLCNSESRNRFIVNLAIKLINDNKNKNERRKILLLSERREHLELLCELLKSKSTGTITYGLYYGNKAMNKIKYKNMLKTSASCDIVLGSHQLASEGLDIPELNTLIFATPRIDVEQSTGRILRKYHLINPLIIDIIDNCKNYKTQSYQRNTYYKSEEYIIVNKSFNLDDKEDKEGEWDKEDKEGEWDRDEEDDDEKDDEEDDEKDDEEEGYEEEGVKMRREIKKCLL